MSMRNDRDGKKRRSGKKQSGRFRGPGQLARRGSGALFLEFLDFHAGRHVELVAATAERALAPAGIDGRALESLDDRLGVCRAGFLRALLEPTEGVVVHAGPIVRVAVRAERRAVALDVRLHDG